MSEAGTTGTPESAPAAPAETSAATHATSLFGDVAERQAPETPEAETVLATGAEAETLTPEEVEELEEIEQDGKKAKVPKEFKDSFLRQQDYTRKTQEVAESRKAIEAQHAEYQRSAQLQQATFAESAKLYANNERLEQFKKLDWDAITKADPVQAMTLERQMRNLEAENAQLAQSITHKQQQMTFSEQQAAAKRAEEGRQQLAREIKGWSPELQSKLVETAKGIGYKPEELAQVSDPRAVKLLHKAYLYDQLMAKQAVKPAPTPLPKPVSKVGGGGATNTKALSDMTAEEHAKWRQDRRNQPRRF